MALWGRLYSTVWLAFFTCVLIPRWLPLQVGLYVHIILGLAMLAMTSANMAQLRALPVPDRLKRISKATAGFALFQFIIGLVLGSSTIFAPRWHIVASIIRGVHVVCGLAMLAQASSVATGYDMWEEKEFETKPEAKE